MTLTQRVLITGKSRRWPQCREMFCSLVFEKLATVTKISSTRPRFSRFHVIDAEGFHATGLEKIYAFETKEVPESVAISGLEYAADTQTLWILTSFEKGDQSTDIGGYLWSLPLEEMPIQGTPSLLRHHDGTALKFNHKSEGVTPLDNHHLLVIHDDDRRVGPALKRALNQAVLQIVKIP